MNTVPRYQLRYIQPLLRSAPNQRIFKRIFHFTVCFELLNVSYNRITCHLLIHNVLFLFCHFVVFSAPVTPLISFHKQQPPQALFPSTSIFPFSEAYTHCLHLNINKCYPNTSPLPLPRLQPSLAPSPQMSMGMAISCLLALETM